MAEKVSLFDEVGDKPENSSKSDSVLSIEVIDILACTCLKKDRYKEVLKKRYGLLGINKMTLDAIGKDLGITRERVRQIENTAVKKLLTPKCGKEHAKKFHQEVIRFLEKNGGFASENLLINKFTKKENDSDINTLFFLLKLNKKIELIKENDYHLNVWVTENRLGEHAKEIIEKAETFLKDRGSKIPENDLIKELEHKLLEGVSILNMLESSKKIDKVKDEDNWGLSHWRDVNPRSIRDKIYIALEKKDKPMHFDEIAEAINKENKETKKVTKQAVNNELIKDDRYVLIGRGIYALSKWGYKEGVVEDVIAEVLDEAKAPMHKDDIIGKVLEKRMVKKATIVLNLQKDRFKRVDKATYALVK